MEKEPRKDEELNPIAAKWADMPRLMAREKFKNRVRFTTLESNEGALEVLHALAPDTEGQQENAYDALKKIGVAEQDRGREVPGWKNLTTNFLKNGLQKTYSWMQQHFNGMSEHRQEIASSFMNTLNTLRSQEVWDKGDATDICRNLRYKELKCCPVLIQDNFFIHCHNYTNSEKVSSDKVEARLYLSPRVNNVTPLVEQIMQKYDTQDRRFYLKFANRGGRNDNLVVYTNYENIDSDLQILQEIQDEHPELFVDMGKNPMWGEIKGGPKGVYFGEEPKETGRTSYGRVRGQIFDKAYQRWKTAYGFDKGAEHERKYVCNENLPPEMVLNFRSMVGEEAEKMGVGMGVSSFCFNEN